jgi:hypothetical protein
MDLILQEDEINSIRSIYEEDEIFSYDDQKKKGNFFVKVELPMNIKEFTVRLSKKIQKF